MSKRQITIPIFIPHFGCRNECIFCNQWTISGSQKKYTEINIKDTVKKYINSMPKTVKHIELAFFGGSFTGIDVSDQKIFLSAASECLTENLIHTIRLSTRPDYIDVEILKLLKSFNVETIELGAQSFCNSVLNAAKRGHDVNDIINASKLIKEYGFKLVIQLMVGLPKDTAESCIFSTQKAIELHADAVRIYPAVVLKHTKLSKMYINGDYTPLTLDEAVKQVKQMYSFFTEKNIPVIRMGLHPLTPSEKDSVLAGPYHPALGFLVKSAIRRDELENIIRDELAIFSSPVAKNAMLSIPALFAEEYIGHEKENISFLKKTFAFRELKYRFENADTPSVSFE